MDCKFGKLGSVQRRQDFKSAADMPTKRENGATEHRQIILVGPVARPRLGILSVCHPAFVDFTFARCETKPWGRKSGGLIAGLQRCTKFNGIEVYCTSVFV
jgi:hypothetical protein